MTGLRVDSSSLENTFIGAMEIFSILCSFNPHQHPELVMSDVFLFPSSRLRPKFIAGAYRCIIHLYANTPLWISITLEIHKVP
jgi:hypothetical protein